jgi:hypothetical protein
MIQKGLPILENGVSIVSWRMSRICTVGILLIGLARAATNAPSELLLKLQEEIQQGNLVAASKQLDVALKEFPSDPAFTTF